MSVDIGRHLVANIHDAYRRGKGHSRHDDKRNGADKERIYSRSTLENYASIAGRYGNWVREHEGRKCTMERARELVPQWLEEGRRAGKSAPTLHTEREALAKAFGCKGPELGFVPERRREDITRGRTETESAARAAERCRDDLEMARAFGPRHNKECEKITRESCRWGRDGHIEFVHINKGKGGRERDAFVLPGAGRDILEARWQSAEPGECLFHMADMRGANVHACRADYAHRAYEYAVEHGDGSGKMYRPRDDSGTAWYKNALDKVNSWMGHGAGRYYTIYSNYLTYGN